jgi:hypothetical protein
MPIRPAPSAPKTHSGSGPSAPPLPGGGDTATVSVLLEFGWYAEPIFS